MQKSSSAKARVSFAFGSDEEATAFFDYFKQRLSAAYPELKDTGDSLQSGSTLVLHIPSRQALFVYTAFAAWKCAIKFKETGDI